MLTSRCKTKDLSAERENRSIRIIFASPERDSRRSSKKRLVLRTRFDCQFFFFFFILFFFCLSSVFSCGFEFFLSCFFPCFFRRLPGLRRQRKGKHFYCCAGAAKEPSSSAGRGADPSLTVLVFALDAVASQHSELACTFVPQQRSSCFKCVKVLRGCVWLCERAA